MSQLDHFNRTIARGAKRAWELEPKLAAIVEKILVAAGREAADRFQATATNHLTASGLASELARGGRETVRSLVLTSDAGVRPNSTMVALKPRADEAAALEHLGGPDADTLHVTLAYLGEIEGSLAPVQEALMRVAAGHAPLEGAVAGVGAFEDNGKGAPLILLPSVPGLVELRVEVTEALTGAGLDFSRNYGYQAHMTVMYAPDDMTMPSRGSLGQPLHFDALLIVRGDRETIELPFTGVKPLTAAGDVPPWTPPSSSEVLDLDKLMDSLRTKTDPVRQAVIESVAKESLDGVGIAYDVTNPFIGKAIANTASQITEISDTTRADVMSIIGRSYDEGLSIPDTAKAITAGMSEAAGARSTLIARTELVGAVNGGSLAATQLFDSVTGGGYQKQWLTAPGATFPRHEDYDGLDGQTTSLDGLFQVGADQLQYPGDPSGSPEEVCNCRCTIVYLEGSQEVGGGDADTGPGDVPDGMGDQGGGGAASTLAVVDQAARELGGGGDATAAAPEDVAAVAAPVADTTAEETVAAPTPPDRPFQHYAPATLKTQIYRSKVLLRDLTPKLADRTLTADERLTYDKHVSRLQQLIQEKRFRESGPDRPFAHYAEATLKTQIYRAKKLIADIEAKPIPLSEKDLAELRNARDRLYQLNREQVLRDTESDFGAGKVKPVKPTPAGVTPTPTPTPPVPPAKAVSPRVDELRLAYASRPNWQTLREARFAANDLESPNGMMSLEPRIRAIGEQFANEVEERLKADPRSQFATTSTRLTARRDAVLSVLRDVRETGFGRRTDPIKTTAASDATLKVMARKAAEMFPKDWIDKAAEGGRSIKYKRVQRGYFSDGYPREIAISGRSQTIVGDSDGFSTMVHEMGHLMEVAVPGVKELEAAFYYRRTEGEALIRYRWGTDREVVRPDEFTNEYIGKDYSYGAANHIGDEWAEMPDSSHPFEILSMGLEGVLNGEHRIWSGDPDLRNFILGMLVSL